MNRQPAASALFVSAAIALSVALALIGVSACSKADSGTTTTATTNATSAPPKVNANGATIYKERCAACHGTEGKGDGMAAATLNPKPRDHTDKAWQASVGDEEIRKTILLGGAGVGKSPMMPGSPDLAGSPEVVTELVKIVRGFGGK